MRLAESGRKHGADVEDGRPACADPGSASKDDALLLCSMALFRLHRSQHTHYISISNSNSIKNNLYLVNVDVSASTEAFLKFETVCLIAVRHSVSGRIGRRRCGRVGKTPRLRNVNINQIKVVF